MKSVSMQHYTHHAWRTWNYWELAKKGLNEVHQS